MRPQFQYSVPRTPDPITTTNREVWTQAESEDLAARVFKRFGRDIPAAAAAWRRLLQNNCSDEQFRDLLKSA